jgi:hypothetical protein
MATKRPTTIIPCRFWTSCTLWHRGDGPYIEPPRPGLPAVNIELGGVRAADHYSTHYPTMEIKFEVKR